MTRLIDADALKEHKFLTPQVKVIGGRHSGKLKEQIIQAYQKGWNDCTDAIIDNAPTIDTFSFQDMNKAIEVGRKFGKLEEKTGRPHGEWIDRMADKGYVECPFCHKQITGGDLNFCVKCGADMRKGGAE